MPKTPHLWMLEKWKIWSCIQIQIQVRSQNLSLIDSSLVQA